MPLIDFWKASPASVAAMGIEQIVAVAGNGQLTDGSTCSRELREYLTGIGNQKLSEYAKGCLATKFSVRGLVLQDLVNELGRRLGFVVNNGRYQGIPSEIGFDGLWLSPAGNSIVVEVKTSDAFSINLDTISEYRTELLDAGRIDRRSSMLLIVGNADTGSIEAQVRGSRHAWDMRLISVRALTDLVRLHEASRSPDAQTRIRLLLTPLEFTRLDALADVLLETAEGTADAREAALVNSEIEESGGEDGAAGLGGAEVGAKVAQSSSVDATDRALLTAIRTRIVCAFEKKENVQMVPRTSATFSTADKSIRIACTISKFYGGEKTYPYWYAFHPTWRTFLGAGTGFLCLGFVNLESTAIVPMSLVEGLLPYLNTTTRLNGDTYWHIHVIRNQSGALSIRLKSRGARRFDALPGRDLNASRSNIARRKRPSVTYTWRPAHPIDTSGPSAPHHAYH